MPESPRWLLHKTRRAEAVTALRWLRGPREAMNKELAERNYLLKQVIIFP